MTYVNSFIKNFYDSRVLMVKMSSLIEISLRSVEIKSGFTIKLIYLSSKFYVSIFVSSFKSFLPLAINIL